MTWKSYLASITFGALGVLAGVAGTLWSSETARVPEREPCLSPGPSSPEAESSTTATASEPPEAVLARGDLEAPPDGQISGHVFSSDGNPLEGVVVLAQPERGSEIESPSAFTSRSGSDGRYRIAVPPGLTFRLSARHDTLSVVPAQGCSPIALMGGDEMDFIATPLIPVTFSVDLPDGSPAPRATIELMPYNMAAPDDVRAWHPARPTLGLIQRSCWVRASAPTGLLSESLELAVTAASTSGVVHLQLRSHRGIRGVLRVSELDRASTLTVSVVQRTEPTTPEGDPARRAVCEVGPGDRSFAFLDLARGPYAVEVTRGSDSIASKLVDLVDGVTAVAIDVPAPPTERIFHLRAIDGNGRPIASPRVAVRVEHENGSDGYFLGCSSSADGWLRLILDEAAADAISGRHGSSCRVFVTPLDRPTQSAVLTAAGNGALTLIFDDVHCSRARVHVEGCESFLSRGQLTLEIVQDGGAAAEWYYDTWHDSDVVVATATVDSSAMAYLPPLPPGDYHLGILFETWSSKGHLLRDQPLHLDAGRPEIALAMPSLLSLTVHVEGDDLVALQGLDNGLPHARTKPDALGNATFSDLPRGQYQVYFKESVMTLVLATSTSLPFLPDPRTENR